MSEIQMAHFSFGGVAPERSNFHGFAVREARGAAHRQEPTVDRAPRPTLASRFRLAFAGSPASTTEACNCPA
jgi:hypothetical protein